MIRRLASAARAYVEARYRRNVRALLADQGAACPDDGEGYAPPFNLVDIRDLYTPEAVADFDLWAEQVRA